MMSDSEPNELTKAFVVGELEFIEKKHNIDILFAVESGSRLWGMASEDSDWDVRFIYRRPLKHYLGLKSYGYDVIETSADDKLDIVGWDVKKFFSLVLKSNPAAMEWLKSHIVYKGRNTLLKVQPLLWCFNARAMYEHYRSLARSNFERYIMAKDKPKRKKYLYVSRGMVNAMYCLQIGKVPPSLLVAALDRIEMDEQVKASVRQLIDEKTRGSEMGESDHLLHLDKAFDNFFNAVGLHRELLLMRAHDIPREAKNKANELFFEVMGVE